MYIYKKHQDIASLSHMLIITQLVISIKPAMNYTAHPLMSSSKAVNVQ